MGRKREQDTHTVAPSALKHSQEESIGSHWLQGVSAWLLIKKFDTKGHFTQICLTQSFLSATCYVMPLHSRDIKHFQ